MVTKKQRRRAIAHASVQRRTERLTARARRRRWLQIAATTLVVLVAVAGLVVWIVLHEDDGEATAATEVGLTTSAAVLTPNEVSR